MQLFQTFQMLLDRMSPIMRVKQFIYTHPTDPSFTNSSLWDDVIMRLGHHEHWLHSLVFLPGPWLGATGSIKRAGENTATLFWCQFVSVVTCGIAARKEKKTGWKDLFVIDHLYNSLSAKVLTETVHIVLCT